MWGAPQLALAGPQPYSALQSFFEGPNRMYANSFTTVKRSKRDNGVSGAMGVPTEELQPAKHQAENARSVDVGNRYAALGREDTNNDEGLTVMLADAIKPPSRNRMKKEKKGQLCSGFKDTQCSSSSCLGCDTQKHIDKQTDFAAQQRIDKQTDFAAHQKLKQEIHKKIPGGRRLPGMTKNPRMRRRLTARNRSPSQKLLSLAPRCSAR